jgi:WD40 repeat protein
MNAGERMRAFRLVVVLLFAGSIGIPRLHATELGASERMLPQGVAARLGAPVRSSKHQAVAIAFSPDDQILACAGLRTHSFRDSQTSFPIEVFRTDGLKQTNILEGADRPIQTLLIGPENDLLAAFDSAGVLQLWDLSSGERLWANRQLDAKQVAFSADKKHLFVADLSERVWVVDREGGDVVREHTLASLQASEQPALPGTPPWATPGTQQPGEKRDVRVEFSQEDGTMTVHEEGKEPVKINLRAIGRSMSYWRRICLLPDGKNLAWLTDDGTFEIRDAMTGDTTAESGFETGVAILRKFSAKDKAPSPVGLLWPSSNCQSIQVRVSDVASIIGLATCQAEKTLFSWPPPASWLKGDYSLSADVPTGRPRGVGQAKMAWYADSLAISPSGTRAALMGRREANRSEVRVIDLEQETTLRTFALESRYRERKIYRGRVNDGRQIRALKPVTGAFSHDDRFLAAEMLGEIRLLNIETGKEITGQNATTGDAIPVSQEHEDKIAAVVFSPDASLVATASYDSTIRVWSTSTGKELLRREHEWLSASQHIVAFSPDGSLLAAGLGNKVEILRCSDGESICQLQGEPVTSPSGRATALGFSPSGNRIASWNGSRRSLTWWSVPAGRQLRTAKVELVPEDKPREGPTHSDGGSNQSFSFSPNMRRLATTAYLDRILIQCDTWTGNRLHQVSSQGNLGAACFSTDMKRFAVGGDGEPFRVFDTQTGELLQTIAPAGRRRGELSGYWMNPSYDTRLGIASGSGAERPRVFLDQGRVLATEDLVGTRFYDLESGTVIGEIPEYGIRAVSRDGRLVATVTVRNVVSVNGDLLTTASTVLIWDAAEMLNQCKLH